MQLLLREWRRVRNISQAALAKELGVATSTVNNWETGKNKMPVDKALEACKVLEVDFDKVNFLPSDATKCSD